MKSLVELLNRLLALLERWLYKREQRSHEQTVSEIQNNPGEFLADHFSGLQQLSTDAAGADAPDAERDDNTGGRDVSESG